MNEVGLLGAENKERERCTLNLFRFISLLLHPFSIPYSVRLTFREPLIVDATLYI
jgi:hypothetical protein